MLPQATRKTLRPSLIVKLRQEVSITDCKPEKTRHVFNSRVFWRPLPNNWKGWGHKGASQSSSLGPIVIQGHGSASSWGIWSSGFQCWESF